MSDELDEPLQVQVKQQGRIGIKDLEGRKEQVIISDDVLGRQQTTPS